MPDADKYLPKWGIYDTQSDSDYPIAAFWSKAKCWQYIDFMKQEVFFATGSMEEAEKAWDRNRYTVERTVVCSKKDTAKYFYENFDKWPD
jgi:hypothetical protein